MLQSVYMLARWADVMGLRANMHTSSADILRIESNSARILPQGVVHLYMVQRVSQMCAETKVFGPTQLYFGKHDGYVDIDRAAGIDTRIAARVPRRRGYIPWGMMRVRPEGHGARNVPLT